MDFGHLFASFEGRINRKPYWVATIVLVIAAMIINVAAVVLFGGSFLVPDQRTHLITFILQLIFLYPGAAVMVKRLHDRNRPTAWAAFILVPLILQGLSNALGITGDPQNQNALDYIFSIVIFVVSIWFFVELGCLRGTIGSNRYGPDPLGATPAPFR